MSGRKEIKWKILARMESSIWLELIFSYVFVLCVFFCCMFIASVCLFRFYCILHAYPVHPRVHLSSTRGNAKSHIPLYLCIPRVPDFPNPEPRRGHFHLAISRPWFFFVNPIVFPEKHCQLYFSRSITTPRYRFQLRFYLDTYISWSNPRNFSRALNWFLSWRSHLTCIRTHHPHHHCLAWRRKSPPLHQRVKFNPEVFPRSGYLFFVL